MDYHLPNIAVYKNFYHYMNYVIDESLNLNESYCVIAHPPDTDQSDRSVDTQLSNVLSRLHANSSQKKRIVIAVGPEGGWEEDEVMSFEEKGFHRVSLGQRILRTDIAVPVALGITNQWIDSHLTPL